MTDFLIVGCGLSGIAVSERLLQKNKTIKVYENFSQRSSRVAGGLINPVILKRFTLAWNADIQMHIALHFYGNLEKKLGVEFLKKLPIYRKFSSVEEQNNWFEASDKNSLSKYLNPKLLNSINPNIHGQFQFGEVMDTYVLDTESLLNAFQNYLKKEGLLEDEKFDQEALKIEKHHLEYKGELFRNIIFCEGFGLQQNPFFNYLPLRGNKGEYLIIKSENLQLEVAVKSSIFILPLGNNLYKIGATYNNVDTGKEPTREARLELEKQLQKLITCDYEIVDQVAGIRPTTPDRKPLVGRHPEFSNIYCCNGIGSRGVLIAPTAAEELLNFIKNDTPISAELDLVRFQKKFYRGPS